MKPIKFYFAAITVVAFILSCSSTNEMFSSVKEKNLPKDNILIVGKIKFTPSVTYEGPYIDSKAKVKEMYKTSKLPIYIGLGSSKILSLFYPKKNFEMVPSFDFYAAQIPTNMNDRTVHPNFNDEVFFISLPYREQYALPGFFVGQPGRDLPVMYTPFGYEPLNFFFSPNDKTSAAYIGTIEIELNDEMIMKNLRIVDEFDEAKATLAEKYPSKTLSRVKLNGGLEKEAIK